MNKYCNVKLMKLIPFIIYHFYKQKNYIEQGRSFKRLNLKTKSRSSTILPLFNHINFQIHNGKTYINVLINSLKYNYKLGEFSFSKIPARHNKKRKKKSK